MTARRIGLVLEGKTDLDTVTILVDRTLVHRIPWLEGILDSQREWVGRTASESFLKWSKVDEVTHPLVASKRIPPHRGHFAGEPGIRDAHTATMALRYFVHVGVDAAVLVRDSDRDLGERRRGLEQARKEHGQAFPVVVGVAHAMREAWVLEAFEPRTEQEKAAAGKEPNWRPPWILTWVSPTLQGSHGASAVVAVAGNRARPVRTNASKKQLYWCFAAGNSNGT